MTTTDKKSYQGVFSLMLTPFQENRTIDWQTYDEYVDWQVSKKPNALFAVCGSSEMKWLSSEERVKLAKKAVSRAGNIPVVATANLDPDITKHKEEISRMKETGISGVVLVPPMYVGEDQQKLGNYFAELVHTADCPVFLYEWPQTNPYFISSQVVTELTKNFDFKGIKDTTCTMEGIKAKITATDHRAVVFQANTPFMLESIAKGAQGIMATTSAALAELVIDFWKVASKDSSSSSAKTFHQQLVFLDSVLRFGYPATAKYLAQLQGVKMGLTCRWPVELNPEAKKAVAVFYEAYKQWKSFK